jgi:hypothetical protein
MSIKKKHYYLGAFTVGKLYLLINTKKSNNSSGMLFLVSGIGHYELKLGQVVVYLGKTTRFITEVEMFLLPNGTIGTISILNFIPNVFAGFKLVEVKNI